MVACFVAIVLLSVVSFFGGRLLLYCFHRTEPGCCAVLASGSVMLFFGSFLIQLLALSLRQSFQVIKWGNVIYAALLVIFGCAVYIAERKKSKRIRRTGEGKWNRKQLLRYGSMLIVFVLNVSVMLWYEPYFGNDMTVEETGTILQTGMICRYHPGTGAMLEFGMNAGAKLNFMPGLYAVLCDLTGAKPYLLICRWIPVWGLLLNYAAVFFLLDSACCFGKSAGKKEECNAVYYAMVLYGMLLLFGDYQAYTYAFRLLHQGWNPYVILWASVPAVIFGGALCLFKGHTGKGEKKHAECME